MTSSLSGSPLSWMQPLSPAVSYYDGLTSLQGEMATSTNTNTTSRQPKLIVILFWMGAREEHTSKYIRGHRALFPASSILVVRSTVWGFISTSHTMPQLEPAATLLEGTAHHNGKSTEAEQLEAAISADKGDPDVLLHVFSNGGVANLTRLFDLLRARNADTLNMPLHATIFDSCPGYFSWATARAALAQSLPSWLAPLSVLMVAASWIAGLLTGGLRQPQDINADAANATDVAVMEVRRGYVYGDSDAVVDWHDVEKHAAMATGKGKFRVMRMGKFHKARHVESMKLDGDRYWRVVRGIWEG